MRESNILTRGQECHEDDTTRSDGPEKRVDKGEASPTYALSSEGEMEQNEDMDCD